MNRYESKRFKVDVDNYTADITGKPMKHLRIYTESPCQVDLWLTLADVEVFLTALEDNEPRR